MNPSDVPAEYMEEVRHSALNILRDMAGEKGSTASNDKAIAAAQGTGPSVVAADDRLIAVVDPVTRSGKSRLMPVDKNKKLSGCVGEVLFILEDVGFALRNLVLASVDEMKKYTPGDAKDTGNLAMRLEKMLAGLEDFLHFTEDVEDGTGDHELLSSRFLFTTDVDGTFKPRANLPSIEDLSNKMKDMFFIDQRQTHNVKVGNLLNKLLKANHSVAKCQTGVQFVYPESRGIAKSVNLALGRNADDVLLAGIVQVVCDVETVFLRKIVVQLRNVLQ